MCLCLDGPVDSTQLQSAPLNLSWLHSSLVSSTQFTSAPLKTFIKGTQRCPFPHIHDISSLVISLSAISSEHPRNDDLDRYYAEAQSGQLRRMGINTVRAAQSGEEATRTLDKIAARRRRLPMVEFPTHHTFSGPGGTTKTLLDLFEGRDRLVVYQFMDNGPDSVCEGCTYFTNGVAPQALAELRSNGISWATVSDMPIKQFEGLSQKMDWKIPFYSSHGTSFAKDCGATSFWVTAFLRDGEHVYRTYRTKSRGVDRIIFANNIMDITVYGRQESWEDSPEGWPQHPTYGS